MDTKCHKLYQKPKVHIERVQKKVKKLKGNLKSKKKRVKKIFFQDTF